MILMQQKFSSVQLRSHRVAIQYPEITCKSIHGAGGVDHF